MNKLNKEEVNEFLAEKLFGYEKYTNKAGIVYFMKQTPTEQYPNSKTNVGEYSYIKNYQPVLEKLSKLCYEITIEVLESGMAEITAKYHFGIINVVGNILGEAICNAAVEYLKTKQSEKCGEEGK